MRSLDVARALGITYRQLDYLVREGGCHPRQAVAASSGAQTSGCRRDFDLHHVHRLAAAVALNRAASVRDVGAGGGHLPHIARLTAEADTGPPATGWVVLLRDPDRIIYAETDVDLVAVVADPTIDGAVVARLDLRTLTIDSITAPATADA